jgi:hypothetical protein
METSEKPAYRQAGTEKWRNREEKYLKKNIF